MIGHFTFPFLWSSLLLIRKLIYFYWHSLKWNLFVWIFNSHRFLACIQPCRKEDFVEDKLTTTEEFWRLHYLIYLKMIYLQNKSGVNWKKLLLPGQPVSIIWNPHLTATCKQWIQLQDLSTHELKSHNAKMCCNLIQRCFSHKIL